MTTEDLFDKYLKMTGDPLAASNLVLAESLRGDESSPLKPLTQRDINVLGVKTAMMSSVVTVAEAASLLRVSEASIYELCNSGKLTHSRVGAGRGHIRIRRADLNTYHVTRPATVKARPVIDSISRRLAKAKPRRSPA